MPQFGASLTAIIYAPRVVNYALIFINYAPRINYYIPKKIYCAGITHDDHNMTIIC